jgi:bifunctional non-homologous end joining protein LigD
VSRRPGPDATTRRHPARRVGTHESHPQPGSELARLIPRDRDVVSLGLGGRRVDLTNVRKVYFPGRGYTKGDLLRYYATVAPVLVPHLRDRAMVMRRYPDGIAGESFFMKRVPAGHPDWLQLCSITHASGNIIDFPMVQDVLALLWVVNLGCIDLNEWYARCDDVDRPDYLHFDLDPGEHASFAQVRALALDTHRALDGLGLPNLAKTSGSRGIHVYVPIVRGPDQKDVWAFAKAFALALAAERPELATAEYRRSHRPSDRVLIDYNQNAWGRTLASVYSVRPRPEASVSTPVTWAEVRRGIETADFTIANVPARVRRRKDMWRPILSPRGRGRLPRVP